MMLRRLLPVLLLLLVGLPALSAEPVSAGESFRQASPFYVRGMIPDDPGSIRVRLSNGVELKSGFLGSSELARAKPPKTPELMQMISTPGAKWQFGIAFYQGTSFSWGLPRRFVITSGNRYRGEEEAYGSIRVVIWGQGARYEVNDGSLNFTRFREMGREGQFRKWQIEGKFTGTLRLQANTRKLEALPDILEVLDASFECLVIENRDPVPSSIELTFDHFYRNELLLNARTEFDPAEMTQAFEISARQASERGRFFPYEFLFQIRDASNISWPPYGKYLLGRSTVDPPDIFTQGRGRKPIVSSLIYRPQRDVEFHYQFNSGELQFTNSALLLVAGGKEYWRVKGKLSGTLYLEEGYKIGLGNAITELVIDPEFDLEQVRIIDGKFDLKVVRPARQTPAWKLAHPEIDPNSALYLPSY